MKVEGLNIDNNFEDCFAEAERSRDKSGDDSFLINNSNYQATLGLVQVNMY